jgi:hypothetical protein
VRSAVVATSWALLICSVAGCDDSFQPLEIHDRNFSMYGVLEVGADTQWIRVMPVRDSAFTSPGPLDATVTMENLETGRTVELRDSLIRHSGFDQDVVANLWAPTRRCKIKQSDLNPLMNHSPLSLSLEEKI